MKKTLLLAGTFLILGVAACGAPDTEEAIEGPSQTLETATAALTTQNCSQLSVISVIASGNDGNVPANTLDDRLDTRWSNLGRDSWIDFDLGAERSVSGAAIAWHQGDQRINDFTLHVSTDGMSYTQVYTGKSSGTTTAAETYSFAARTARRLRIYFKGNTVNDWASIAEVRACGTSITSSGVVWRGDFETGDHSQWTRAQMVSADRLQVVSSPLRQGRYALKATVRQGDDPINASGNRNELVRMTREPTGSEYYYKFSTMFASDFPSVKTWQLFTQWHHEGGSGSPPVEFYVYSEEIRLNIGGDPGVIVWKTPLVRSQWQDFILHVKWSPDPSVGFVELYHNGKLVLPKRYIATQYSGMVNYLKVGLYRSDTITQVGTVYHDGWTMARNLSDVL
ncbi:heparin lyase I family protein [Archangium lipolyticum]|uniref:heparin lyase I family protein n=1 Tax=Archangium lipolyticum TaxID=2970465 RepID=UPI00214A446F|nr:heparin lyase I family protein [Archangium lipolyticum]